MKKIRAAIILIVTLPLASCLSFIGWQPEKEVTQVTASQQEQASTAEIYYRLGLRLSNGISGKPDYRKANVAFEKAALAGHLDAQHLLGMAYLVGKGTPRNYNQARHWLGLAGNAGHAKAQQALGNIFLNGRGTEVEEVWGIHWIARSAAQGYGRAQYELGIAYASGLGVPKDIAEAWLWLRLAHSNGHQGAEALLEKLTGQLGEAKLTQAKTRFQQWKPLRRESALPPPKVRFIQHSLNQLGYQAGAVDGLIGPQTRGAIEAFRRQDQEAGSRVSADLITSIRSAMRS